MYKCTHFLFRTIKKKKKEILKQKWIENDKKTKSKQIERILFFMCDEEARALKIASDGFECQEGDNFLGKFK